MSYMYMDIGTNPFATEGDDKLFWIGPYFDVLLQHNKRFKW